MMISDIIQQLKEIQVKHGDIKVSVLESLDIAQTRQRSAHIVLGKDARYKKVICLVVDARTKQVLS